MGKTRNIKANDTFMASFDIKSLFANVLLKEIIDICTQNLYELEKPSLSKENFVKLLKIVTSKCKVLFQ